MDLDEIKAVWSEMSDQLEQQKKLTNEIILKMTQERYSNRFRTLTTFETAGALVCFGVAMLILANMDKLDTWYLFACGIFTLTFLIGLPILVLRSLRKIGSLNITENSYKETIIGFTKERKRLLKIQQGGIFASFILMFAVAAVFSKIFSGKDLFMTEKDPIFYGAIVVAVLFVTFFSRWGYRGYKKVTNSAENILKELE